MTLDIRGSLKNTKLSSNPYVVFEELISNAIDSYLIRKHGDPGVPDLKILVEVDFSPADMFEQQEGISIRCTDNGCGLADEQLKAFLTKDTSYKDDLAISGIGKCKGAGRIQYFHHFSKVEISSTFLRDGAAITRSMAFSEPQKQIEVDDFQEFAGNASEVGTAVKLSSLKETVRNRVFQADLLTPLFSTPVLKRQMLLAFLQRLVGLDGRLGDFEINFVARHWRDSERQDTLRRSDLPVITARRDVDVEERSRATGQALGTYQRFQLSHYKLDAALYDLPRNAISLCAKSSPVKDITARYLRTRTEQNNPVGGFHHLVIIESDYLDRHVNEQRDDFENIPDDMDETDLFSSETLSYDGIYQAIDPVVEEMVVPAGWNKEDVLKSVTDHYGISEAMLQDTSTRIVYGEAPKAVAERVLKKYQERVVSETEEIINLKEQIIQSEPDSEEFRTKINDLSWKYTSSLRNFDMANLSQLVVRRAAIVEILDLASRRQLASQLGTDQVRRKDERIIHSIFFPMRKDSKQVQDHDVWLLSEEYHYFDYIASDTPLASIVWNDGEKIFDSDVDDTLAARLATRAEENKGKRPDIAIFNKEGAAIILEFKAPGVSTDDHIGDLSEYAHLLAAKSGGRLKKFYCYLIGDTVNPLRLSGSWIPFPTGKGWFQSSPLLDPVTRQQLGETYFEILHFSDVIDRAKKRIGVYQEKLKINISGAN